MVAAKLPRGITLLRGRYRVRIDAYGATHSIGVFDTVRDARAALEIAKGERARGTFIPPGIVRAERRAAEVRAQTEGLTLGEWAEQWLADLAANPDRSPSTVVSYRSVLRTHVLPELGATRLVELTPAQIAAHLARLRAMPSRRHPGARANGVAPNAARVLRSCLNAAIKRPDVALDSFAFPEAPSQARVRPVEVDGDIATPGQVAAMAAAMPEHLRAAVLLAAWCALRLGEVLGLERRDLEHLDDPERAILHVRRQWNTKAVRLTDPKRGSTRSVAIPASMLPMLREHLDVHAAPGPDEPVFTPPSRRGRRVSQTSFDTHWRAARSVAGRDSFRFHSLRHTGLTEYARQGATLADLLERGGHTDVSVALRYQHASAQRDRELTARLDEVVVIGPTADGKPD
ncbi:site-specific integrase [Occultella aeris]|uniref:Prophage phiRv2 integrase n=1 Tax=Occultella aeris TaxID=2761496 RepID=A0A7M4DHI5_9MICO|nr:site-specific integrase [Occultella aeris]VZO36378.1 Putative prophage phiRv2 integrase [Occultella aeris]